MSAAAWTTVAPLLEDRFDLIVPTLAGHRGGEPTVVPASISILTDSVERLLDSRDLDTVHVAGNSMGGWIAIELARRGRAASVCALSPAGLWATGDPKDRSRNILRCMRTLAVATRRLTPPLLRFAAVRRLVMFAIAVHAERLTFEQAVVAFEDLVGCSAAEDLLNTAEYLAPLESLPCPITIAWSGNDRIFPPGSYLQTARERLPHARVIVLPGVGHVPMIDAPELCADTIIGSIGGEPMP